MEGMPGMKVEFENFVERRERCKAIRFTHADQAHYIATELFNAMSFTFDAGMPTGFKDQPPRPMSLTLQCIDGEKVIHRGDYIKEADDYSFTLIVVPRKEFEERFEPDRNEKKCPSTDQPPS
jgi:hypothetical protein